MPVHENNVVIYGREKFFIAKTNIKLKTSFPNKILNFFNLSVNDRKQDNQKHTQQQYQIKAVGSSRRFLRDNHFFITF
jgi:hypothetical protein